jgi:RHS repeat-associated protein
VAANSSGRAVTRTYDPRNRLTHLTFPNGLGNQIWTYEKDNLPSSVTAYNDAGNTAPVVTSYTYNKRRLLTGETLAQPGWYSWSVGYAYDGYGHLSTQTYPTGLVVDYAPNPLGQPTKAGTFATGAQYYPNGALKQFTYGNGIVHTMTQNARQLPERTISSGGVLDYQNYYDANGNVEHIANNLGVGWDPRDRWMQYDQLDRLTAAGSGSFGGDHWHRMTYDALDNLKSWKLAGVKDYAEYVYDARNRLASIRNTAGATVQGLDYDPQGNLSNKNGQIYQFDYGNRLRIVNLKETYRYDGLGRRVMNWRWPQPGASTGTLSFSMYSQNGQVPYEEDHHGTPTTAKENIYLAGSVIATRENKWGVSVEVKYQHTDALGSPVAVTNASGQVIERMDYEPWGAIIGKSNHNGIGYTGHVMDAATGLTYMQQRYYDQSIGRFLSIDPVAALSNPGLMFNRYKYAGNSPYRFIDPDGRAELNVFRQGDGPFYKATEAFNLSNSFDLGGHGNVGFIQDQTGSNVDNWDGFRAYQEMKGLGLKQGQQVFSISCFFGAADKSGKSAAQIVASRNKSVVYGADGYVNYDEQGDKITLTVWSGRNKSGSRGAFQQFSPQGKGPVNGAAISRIVIDTKSKTATLTYEKETGSHIQRRVVINMEKSGAK